MNTNLKNALSYYDCVMGNHNFYAKEGTLTQAIAVVKFKKQPLENHEGERPLEQTLAEVEENFASALAMIREQGIVPGDEPGVVAEMQRVIAPLRFLLDCDEA